MSERITIDIDMTQLQMVVGLLQNAGVRLQKTSRVISSAVGERGQSTKLLQFLPAINREMRVILNQAPGMNRVIRQYYNLRRIARGAEYALAGKPVPFYLALIVTAIYLSRFLVQQKNEMIKERKRYENLVRRTRGWTHQQFVRGTRDWESRIRGIT